ncbi:TrgA family protein [uncultured Shimia sp.]|uniref:TrgA family protein n=1 Tax=uncultured Shimia sp. TaxID=573152 RepID=UPI002631DED9|nr:TrgA family protein [uncultured Shimia sp.]
MPTGSKLIGALCLGILGAVIAEMVKPLFPEGTGFGYFTYVSFAVGLFVGWKFLGARAAGRGLTEAINNGLTSVIVQVFLALFVFGSYEMIIQALGHRYSEPMEALRGILELGMFYGAFLLNAQVIMTLVVGAIVSGIITDFAYRHWR